MSVSGIPKVQIPLAVKENTPSEERNESQVQKAAEQMKAPTANPASSQGVGQLVNLEA